MPHTRSSDETHGGTEMASLCLRNRGYSGLPPLGTWQQPQLTHLPQLLILYKATGVVQRPVWRFHRKAEREEKRKLSHVFGEGLIKVGFCAHTYGWVGVTSVKDTETLQYTLEEKEAVDYVVPGSNKDRSIYFRGCLHETVRNSASV
jgi:hypothetical protein